MLNKKELSDILEQMLTVPGSLRRAGAVEAASHVRMLILDVDGVCTDGKLYFNDQGEVTKAFDSRDGLGIKTALHSGLDIGIITGRKDGSVFSRMGSLGVKEYYAGYESKLEALAQIIHNTGLKAEQLAYMGDDWIDIDPMRAVGMPMAVHNAESQLKAEALYVTAARGGEGAVREAIEFLLASRRDGKNPADCWIHNNSTAGLHIC